MRTTRATAVPFTIPIVAYLALQFASTRVNAFHPLPVTFLASSSGRIPFKIRDRTGSIIYNPISTTAIRASVEEDGDEYDISPAPDTFDDLVSYDRDQLQQLTVTQLRQQLRLSGKKVSGKKTDLIDRLLDTISHSENPNEPPSSPPQNKKSKARDFAEARGKDLIDVTEYLDKEDKGKETRTTKSSISDNDEDIAAGNDSDDDDNESSASSSSPETWGDEAKIVEDYEGRSIIIDGLSRTVVEFKGSNKKKVEAYVVASRDALKAYLAGGDRYGTLNANAAEKETAVKNMQSAREKASRVPMRAEDAQGEDIDDEEGHYTHIMDRDYGDWGKYSMTGVQMSSEEVKGLLLLSDVNGPMSDDMQTLADKIAFECQPVVVFAPDLFRGNPWKEDESNPGFNERGESYEGWRACHPDNRVSVDIRAAAAVLREQYGVSSISLFGTCYGGGRALEAAARVYPNDTTDDVNEEEGPTHVEPSTCIAWYPTRYDAEDLFGEKSKGVDNADRPNTAVMAIFAGEDDLQGATPEDAAKLKSLLEADDKVKDHMVKVFGGQKHGFAHIGISRKSDDEEEKDRFLEEEFGGVPTNSIGNGDAEVASLLSTAWMETYSRQFLPTIGEAVKDDEQWSNIDMPDLSESHTRDVRAEMEEALENHEDAELDLKRMHPDDFKTPIDDLDDMDEQFYEALKTQPYGASLEDDPDTWLSKLESALERDDLGYLPGFGEVPLDDSVDGKAYW